jgi:4a-hydroxytetrahydrobiopterin dehydratase
VGSVSRLLTDDEITRQLLELPGWARSGGEIRCAYAAPTFPAAIALVDEVALEAEDMNHHPDIDIRWRTTTWVLSTHDAGGLTQLDIELAHRIALHADALGAQPADQA